MVKLFSLGFLFIFGILANAQVSQLVIEIDREDHAKIDIHAFDSIYTLRPSDSHMEADGLNYKFLKGRGGAEDRFGIKERAKRYLVSSMGDTVASYVKSKNLILMGGYRIFEVETDNGWVYRDEAGKQLAQLEFFWNKNVWRYNLNLVHDDEKVAEGLKKVLLLTLVPRAKSNTESGDSDNFYFLLFATGFCSKN